MQTQNAQMQKCKNAKCKIHQTAKYNPQMLLNAKCKMHKAGRQVQYRDTEKRVVDGEGVGEEVQLVEDAEEHAHQEDVGQRIGHLVVALQQQQGQEGENRVRSSNSSRRRKQRGNK